MAHLKQLQYLSLVSKVTTGKHMLCICFWSSVWIPSPSVLAAELENNIGISEKTLAEFIIQLSEGRRSVKEFTAVSQPSGTAGKLPHSKLSADRHTVQVLSENGAALQDSLVLTLWNIIQRLRPSATANGSSKAKELPAGSGLARADDRWTLRLAPQLQQVRTGKQLLRVPSCLQGGSTPPAGGQGKGCPAGEGARGEDGAWPGDVRPQAASQPQQGAQRPQPAQVHPTGRLRAWSSRSCRSLWPCPSWDFVVR